MLDRIDNWIQARTQTLVDWVQQPVGRVLKGLAYGFAAACFVGLAAQYVEIGWTSRTVFRAVTEPLCAILMLAMASRTPFGTTPFAVAARLSVVILSVGTMIVHDASPVVAASRSTADLLLSLFLYVGCCKPPAPRRKKHSHKVSSQ